MKKVAVIHTSAVSLDYLKGLFQEIMPDVEMINIIDDSLLAEVSSVGHITPNIVRRICNYAQEAERLGAQVILNQCSSVGEACTIARNVVSVPYVKIDEPMAAKAVELGGKIGVIATVKSTVAPSCKLIEDTAKQAGKQVCVTPYLVDGALDILMKEKDKAKHDRLVLEQIEKAAKENDVVVLAQGSMVGMLDLCKHIDKPVLASPRMGVENVKKVLDSLQ